MKKIITLTLALFFVAAVSQAQNNHVTEGERTMSLGSRPGFQMDFTNVEVKDVEKRWKDFVKDRFDVKIKKDKGTGEWTSIGVENGHISVDPFDLYSKIEEGSAKKSVKVYVWFGLGSYFLNRQDNPEKTQNAAELLMEFYRIIRKDIVEDEVEVEQDKQKDVENRIKKLKKEKEDLEKDIAAYKEKIKKAEAEIEINLKNQSATELELEKQRKEVDTVKTRLENVPKE